MDEMNETMVNEDTIANEDLEAMYESAMDDIPSVNTDGEDGVNEEGDLIDPDADVNEESWIERHEGLNECYEEAEIDEKEEILEESVVSYMQPSEILPEEPISYRVYTPYVSVPLTILMNHINGQTIWIPILSYNLKMNSVPTDIVDTTMYSDSEMYDERKYATWAARMIDKSDIVVLNISAADGEPSIVALEENLKSELFNNKYVIVRLDSDLPVELVNRIAQFIDPLQNVLSTFDDKQVIQSIYAVAQSFN